MADPVAVHGDMHFSFEFGGGYWVVVLPNNSEVSRLRAVEVAVPIQQSVTKKQ
jgi:hypothetical protein